MFLQFAIYYICNCMYLWRRGKNKNLPNDIKIAVCPFVIQEDGHSQNIDPGIRQKIKELVRLGIDDHLEIARLIKEHVWATEGFIDMSNRRFYPTAKNIQNHIRRTKQKMAAEGLVTTYVSCLIYLHLKWSVYYRFRRFKKSCILNHLSGR